MKRLLTTVALCLIAASAFAQAKSLRVINTTGCTVYYRVLANNTACPLGTFGTTIIAFPPGDVTYPSSSALGLPPELILNAAYAYPNPGCLSAVYQVGDPCTGLPLGPLGMYSAFSGCNVCRQHYIEWIPAAAPGGQARLLFYL